MSRLANVIHTIRQLTAAPKDRDYLEKLNLKQLQKTKKPDPNQDKKDFFQALQQEAAQGPLFEPEILELVAKLPELPKPITKWLANMGDVDLRDVNAEDLLFLIKWVNEDESVGTRIQKMSWSQAMDVYHEWAGKTDDTEDYGHYVTNNVVMQLDDGYKIVMVSPMDVDYDDNGEPTVDLNMDLLFDVHTEGRLMQNCLKDGNYDESILEGRTEIYSLRDSKNEPHASMEVTDERMIQCLGKQNKSPDPKYNKYLTPFFDELHLYEGYDLLNIKPPDNSSNDTLAGGTISMRLRLLRSRQEIEERLYDVMINNFLGDPFKLEDMCEAIVTKDNVPESVILEIMDHYDDRFDADIASSRSATEAVLERLAANTRDADVAYRIIYNKNTTQAVLDLLADSESVSVRQKLAVHTNNKAILDKLAHDSSYYVTDAVAKNIHISKETRDYLDGMEDDEDTD